MAKVDPEQLEREADELIRQMMGEEAEPEAEEPESAADTEAEDPEPEESAPSDQEETVESAESDPEPEEESGEPEDSDSRIWEERYKNAQARMTKATQEAAELRKEVKSYKDKLDRLETQVSQQKATPATDVDDKDLEQLMADYPEVVGPLIKKIQVLQTKVGETVSSFEEREQQAELERHFEAIRAEHPDLDEVTASDDWEGWLDRQSPTWKRIAGEGTAEEVVDLVSRYKQDMGLVKPQVKREARVEQARKVSEPKLPKARKPDPNGGKKVWSMTEINRMPTELFLKHEAEIDQAILEGRVRD